MKEVGLELGLEVGRIYMDQKERKGHFRFEKQLQTGKWRWNEPEWVGKRLAPLCSSSGMSCHSTVLPCQLSSFCIRVRLLLTDSEE